MPEGGPLTALLQDVGRKSWAVMSSVAGKPVAYKLMANAAPTMLATPHSLLQKRGGFALKNLWVTPHSDAERWPAGDYTIQSKGGEGLPLWTQQVCAILACAVLLCC